MKVTFVRENGHVDVYRRKVDPYWGRVWYEPVPGVETVAPERQRKLSLRALLLGGLSLLGVTAGGGVLGLLEIFLAVSVGGG